MTPGRGRRVLRLTAGGSCVELASACVRRVVRSRRLLSLPLTRPEVEGVLVGAGEVVPVYRLEDIDGRAPAGTSHRRVEEGAGAIVILEEDGALAGFLVEKAEFVPSGEGDPDRKALSETKHRLFAAAGVTMDIPQSATSAVATAEGESQRDKEEGVPG